jgi:hypothetical protein
MKNKKTKPQKKVVVAVAKRQLYLNLKLSEIEFIRAVGGGSFTNGLRALVAIELPPVQMADIYHHRTSVRITPDDVRNFMDKGNGSVTFGIRRAMQAKLDSLQERGDAIS